MARTWTPISEPTSRPPKRWIVLDREARPAAALRLAAEREPEADDEAEDDVRRDARCARRVPDRRARASRACLHRSCVARDQRRSRRPRRPAPTKRPGIPRASSQSGPRSPSRKPAFAATSARGTRAGRGHLLPARLARLAGRRVHEVRAARRRAARREAARDDADRAAGGERDVDRPAHGEIAADRDEARPVERRRGFVDGERLHDAVQVEREPRRAREQPSGDGDLGPAAAERRVDEPFGLRRPRRAPLQRAREERRDGEHAAPASGSRATAPTRDGRG